MKKITRLIAMILAVAMVFSGCAAMEVKTTIKSDSTAVSNIKLELDKAKYDEMAIKNNPDIKTSADVEKALKEQYASAGSMLGTNYKLEVVTKDDNKQYYIITASETEKLTTDNKYTSAGVYGFKDFYLTKDTVYITYDGAELLEMVKMMNELDAGTNYDLNSVKFTYIVEFPENIVSSQGGTVDSTNPKSISFNLPISGKATAFATTKANVTVSTVKADIKKITQVNAPKIKSVKVKSVKKNKGTVSLKYSKIKGAIYEVQYSTSKKFTKKTTKTKTTSKTSVTIKKLKAKKKYYFRVRAVKEDDLGINAYYSKYSKKKTVKVVKKK